jgi:prolyl 4-hydroxylase
VDRDVETLRQRAGIGDAAALTALGKRLLVGDGVQANPQEALALITQAANRDHAEAVGQLALFAAWGVLQPRNINQALERLARAAALGSVTAQEELRFLARESGTDWGGLRRNVNVADWTRARPLKVMSENPLICVLENFLSPEECRWVIARGGAMARAKIYRQDAPGLAVDQSRTNSESDFDVTRADIVINLIRERIANSMRVPMAYFEIAKLLHYNPGEQFGIHADYLDIFNPVLAREIAQYGQRVSTFLVYLNNEFEGGETEFPRVNYKFKGRTGDAIVFRNVDTAGQPDVNTTHAGLPPTSGEKWLFSQWIRNKPIGGG